MHIPRSTARPAGRAAVAAFASILASGWLVLGPASAVPIPDPGVPYVDANCDRAYDVADGDVAVPIDTILESVRTSGRFDTAEATGDYVPPPAPACLVWPPSVQLTTHAPIALELVAGVHLVFLGRIDLRMGSVVLWAADRLEADGAALFAREAIELNAGTDETSDGTLSVVRAKIRSSGGDVLLFATTAIRARAIDVRARGGIVLANDNLVPGDIDAELARLRSREGEIEVTSGFYYDDLSPVPADGVAVRLNRAKIGGIGVHVATYGARIEAERARIQGSLDDRVLLDSAGGAIAMDRIRVNRTGTIDIWTWVEPENPTQRTRVLASRASLRGDDVEFVVGACGGSRAGPSEILASGMTLVAASSATLTATSTTDPGFIDVSGTRLHVSGAYPNDLRVQAADAAVSTIDARGADVRDPTLPTFFAEVVLGDPTPDAIDLAFGEGLILTPVSATQLRAEWTVVNQGPRDVGPGTRLRLLHSADGSLDADDVELATHTITTVIPGHFGRAPGSIDLSVPAGESFDVIAVLDPDDVVPELNEHNNLTATRRPLPDLRFPATPDLTLLSDTTARVAWGMRNGGTLAAPAGVEIGFYLSADAVLDATDALLRTVTLTDPLGPGAGVGGLEVFDGLPATGLFFVIVMADPSDAVLEAAETNNRRSVGVGPDLTITRLSARYSIAAQAFTIEVGIANEGLRPAVGLIETYVRLLPLPEQPLGSVFVDGLAAGTLAEVQTMVVPFPYEPADDGRHPLWWVDAVTDAGEVVAETDEVNNSGTLVSVFWVP